MAPSYLETIKKALDPALLHYLVQSPHFVSAADLSKKKKNQYERRTGSRQKEMSGSGNNDYLKMVAENMMKTCDNDCQRRAKQTKSFVFHFGSP